MSHRLSVVLEIAEREEQTEAAKLARLNQRLESQRQRREQLQSYGDEYQARIAANARHGINAHMYREHRQFIEHINNSIKAQSHESDALRRLIDQQHQRWAEARTRVKSLQRAIEKSAQAKADKRERYAEMAADEWAQGKRSNPVDD